MEEPHTAVVGENRGKILNLTDKKADGARSNILEMSHENPERMIKEIEQIGKPASEMILMHGGKSKPIQTSLFPELEPRSIVMPAHHDVQAQDVDLK